VCLVAAFEMISRHQNVYHLGVRGLSYEFGFSVVLIDANSDG